MEGAGEINMLHFHDATPVLSCHLECSSGEAAGDARAQRPSQDAWGLRAPGPCLAPSGRGLLPARHLLFCLLKSIGLAVRGCVESPPRVVPLLDERAVDS